MIPLMSMGIGFGCLNGCTDNADRAGIYFVVVPCSAPELIIFFVISGGNVHFGVNVQVIMLVRGKAIRKVDIGRENKY